MQLPKGTALLFPGRLVDHFDLGACRHRYLPDGGSRALRNAHAPLSSRTIAEYWNRYYYDFKELLADMFFYPNFHPVF